MAQIAEETGIGQEALYKAMRADSQPRFDTISRVCKALGLKYCMLNLKLIKIKRGTMWIELGIFFLVLMFGIHQIRDVRKEQRKRAEREHAENNESK